MLKNILLIILIISLSFIRLSAQNDTLAFGTVIEMEEDFFACNLVPSYTGGLLHLAVIHIYNDSSRQINFLTKEQFLNQIAGLQKSKANSKLNNLFKKYGIRDTLLIDQLWKLRYSEWPYENTSGRPIEKGWSVNPKSESMPSEGQMEMLKEFGFIRITDYIYGENLFKLLKKLEDPDWITKYKQKE
jgi:hypothetical protein